jgi:hypothetical protein
MLRVQIKLPKRLIFRNVCSTHPFSILLVVDSDVYVHKICLDTFKSPTTNMKRWEDVLVKQLICSPMARLLTFEELVRFFSLSFPFKLIYFGPAESRIAHAEIWRPAVPWIRFTFPPGNCIFLYGNDCEILTGYRC